jgi:hypothetical protein
MTGNGIRKNELTKENSDARKAAPYAAKHGRFLHRKTGLIMSQERQLLERMKWHMQNYEGISHFSYPAFVAEIDDILSQPITRPAQPGHDPATAPSQEGHGAGAARETGDTLENTLHWHALNFRTAGSQHANAAWLVLEEFVTKIKRQRNTAQAEVKRLQTVLGNSCKHDWRWMQQEETSASSFKIIQGCAICGEKLLLFS